MKFTMTRIAAAVALAATANAAQALDVSSISITGGSFSMGQPASATCGAGGPFDSCQLITGSTTFNAGDGLTATAGTALFNYFGTPVTGWLAPSASGAQDANDWTAGFQGTTDGSTIDLNLGGFYANWNGTNFLQGTDSTAANGTSTSAVGTITSWDSATNTGTYEVTWHSYIVGGSFNGQTGYWSFTGTVAAVPEASTYGMMLAGLGLVGFAVRRRRLMA